MIFIQKTAFFIRNRGFFYLPPQITSAAKGSTSNGELIEFFFPVLAEGAEVSEVDDAVAVKVVLFYQARTGKPELGKLS